MTQFLRMSLGVLALSLLAAGKVEAHGPGGHHGSHHAAYHTVHGTKFSHGYYYRGHHHRHWTYTTWNAKYRTRFYWDPSAEAWYYWSSKQEIYYPVSYIETAPPVIEKAPATTVTVTVTTSVPTVPAGSGPLQPFVPPAE
jgi:hypothetical protein